MLTDRYLSMIAAFFVFLGCGLGGLARYGVGVASERMWGTHFPWGTLFVNITGSLCIGVLTIVLLTRLTPGQTWPQALLITGFLGGYTTFSAFSMQTIELFLGGQANKAVFYIVLSVVLSLLAAWGGFLLGKRV